MYAVFIGSQDEILAELFVASDLPRSNRKGA
jgi:hypothetical protein